MNQHQKRELPLVLSDGSILHSAKKYLELAPDI